MAIKKLIIMVMMNVNNLIYSIKLKTIKIFSVLEFITIISPKK